MEHDEQTIHQNINFEQAQNDPQFYRMTREPIHRLIPSLALPTTLSMMISAIYNTADTYFVSKLGNSASAAVGVVFSFMSLLQAFGFTLGLGSASIISRRLGARDLDAANRYGTSAFFAAMILGVLVIVFGLNFLTPLVQTLGATVTIEPYAKAYAQWIIIGAPFLCTSFVMNNILRSEGHAAFSAIAMTSGGILNLFLDPIFIFTLKLGTAGAAIATIISQFVSFCILLQFFIRKKGTVSFSIKFVSHKLATYLDIITTGISALFRQGLASVATIILNKTAGAYGDTAIAAMTITTKLSLLAVSAMLGIGQGFSPVVGYNYGAKLYDRVRKAFTFTVGTATALLLVVAGVYFVFAPQIIYMVRADTEVAKIGAFALRAQAITIPLHAVVVSTNMLLQASGKKLQVNFLSTNRQGLYFIPLILILSRLLGLLGVEIAQAIADVFATLTVIPFIVWYFKNLGKPAN